ncbi:MAG: shikimate kinase [Lachnospiraceae bacterium]|nr:shikimate kinase [Lachnospiraceae bacterium]
MSEIERNIFLIGFMGAGKSTIARELAKELKTERVEMDQMIVEQQKMPISEIFDQFGEEHFRDIETALVKELKNKKGVVVSCGGGAVLRDENAKLMKENGMIVLLTATPETIYERVKNSTDRPILNGNMNVEYISSLMDKRKDRYLAVADYAVATDGKSVKEICAEIIAKMQE